MASTPAAQPKNGSIAQVEPITPKDESAAEFQQFLTSFMFPLSIFGASTFMVVTQQMTDPAEIWRQPTFSLQTARTFIAIAWLCFILTLAMAGFVSSGLVLLRKKHSRSADLGQEKLLWRINWGHLGMLASLVMYILIVAAFLFLSLAMTAYVGVVGWVAVGFCALAGLAACIVTLVDK